MFAASAFATVTVGSSMITGRSCFSRGSKIDVTIAVRAASSSTRRPCCPGVYSTVVPSTASDDSTGRVVTRRSNAPI